MKALASCKILLADATLATAALAPVDVFAAAFSAGTGLVLLLVLICCWFGFESGVLFFLLPPFSIDVSAFFSC